MFNRSKLIAWTGPYHSLRSPWPARTVRCSNLLCTGCLDRGHRRSVYEA